MKLASSSKFQALVQGFKPHVHDMTVFFIRGLCTAHINHCDESSLNLHLIKLGCCKNALVQHRCLSKSLANHDKLERFLM